MLNPDKDMIVSVSMRLDDAERLQAFLNIPEVADMFVERCALSLIIGYTKGEEIRLRTRRGLDEAIGRIYFPQAYKK